MLSHNKFSTKWWSGYSFASLRCFVVAQLTSEEWEERERKREMFHKIATRDALYVRQRRVSSLYECRRDGELAGPYWDLRRRALFEWILNEMLCARLYCPSWNFFATGFINFNISPRGSFLSVFHKKLHCGKV